MNVLITGSNGFVGSKLCSTLSRFDKYSVYCAQRSNKSNSKCNFIYADLSQPGWQNLLPDNIEIIVHLAQSPHYRAFPYKADDIFTVNIRSTFELLEWARVHGVKKFIFSSTGNVYAPQQAILHENSACDPNSMYAASKLCSEHLIKQYATFFNIFILRLFSIYGPLQQEMLIPSIIEKIKLNKIITLVNNEGLYLTPLYIDDCIEMILGIIDLPLDKGLTIVNLAGNETIKLSKIVSIISSILNIEPIINVTEGTAPWLCGANLKIKKILGFSPRICFNDGIRITLRES